MADLEELPKAVEKLYTDLWAYRKQNLTTYKNDCYRLEGDSYIKLRWKMVLKILIICFGMNMRYKNYFFNKSTLSKGRDDPGLSANVQPFSDA